MQRIVIVRKEIFFFSRKEIEISAHNTCRIGQNLAQLPTATSLEGLK